MPSALEGIAYGFGSPATNREILSGPTSFRSRLKSEAICNGIDDCGADLIGNDGYEVRNAFPIFIGIYHATAVQVDLSSLNKSPSLCRLRAFRRTRNQLFDD